MDAEGITGDSPDQSPTVDQPVTTPTAGADVAAVQPAADLARPPEDATQPITTRTEPVVPPVADTPSDPTTVTLHPVIPPAGPRRSRGRWLGAGVLVAAIAAISIAVFAVLAGGSTTSQTASFVPKTAPVYMTVRTDLPGDQRAKVADFLAHFPGFKDQSLFDQKVSEALDKVIAQADPKGGSTVYSSKIKPWLGNEVSFAVTKLPTTAGLSTMNSGMASMSPDQLQKAMAAAEPGDVALIVTKDSAAAGAWIESVVGKAQRTETYAGATINLYGATNATYLPVWTLSGSVLIVGYESSVKAALDAHSAGGIDSTAGYKSAKAAMSGDRIGFGYVDIKAYLNSLTASMPGVSGLDVLTSKAGDWAGFALRFESNALVVDTAVDRPAGATAATNRTSTLASQLPRSTIVEAEVHDIGTGVKNAIAAYEQIPAYKAAIQSALDALGRVGGIDNLVGWMGDGSLVVTSDGSTVTGGLVVAAKDDKAAQTEVNELQNLLALAVNGGATVKSRTEAYGGTTITIIDLGDAGSYSSVITGNTSGHVEIAFAAHGNLVVAGVGDAFVKSVVDVKSGSSLADSSRYTSTMDLAHASNSGQLYIDVAAIRTVIEHYLPAAEAARYNADIKPYLVPFDTIAASSVSGDPATSRFVVIVK